jgi:anthranilate phosphoribosyltransferase
VVHGADGLDEISTTGFTKVSECRDGLVHTFYLQPADFGVAKAALADLRGGDATVNRDLTRSLLAGGRGPIRDIVVVNAGAALLVAGRVATLRDGMSAAEAAIDGGRAASLLSRLVDASQAPPSGGSTP